MRDGKVLTLDRFLYKYPCICPKCGKRGYLYERYKRSHISLRGPYLLVRHRVSSNYDKRKYRLARLNGLDPYTAANHATISKMKDCYVKGPSPTPNRLRKYESVAPPDYGESGKFSDFPYGKLEGHKPGIWVRGVNILLFPGFRAGTGLPKGHSVLEG